MVMETLGRWGGGGRGEGRGGRRERALLESAASDMTQGEETVATAVLLLTAPPHLQLVSGVVAPKHHLGHLVADLLAALPQLRVLFQRVQLATAIHELLIPVYV